MIGPIRLTFWEDESPPLAARLNTNAGVVATQSDFTGITCSIFDLDSSTPETAISTPSIVVVSVIYNTLQTAGWTIDGTGYNFLHSPSASIFSNGDRRYRVEYVLDFTSGDDRRLIFEPTAMKIYAT